MAKKVAVKKAIVKKDDNSILLAIGAVAVVMMFLFGVVMPMTRRVTQQPEVVQRVDPGVIKIGWLMYVSGKPAVLMDDGKKYLLANAKIGPELFSNTKIVVWGDLSGGVDKDKCTPAPGSTVCFNGILLVRQIKSAK